MPRGKGVDDDDDDDYLDEDDDEGYSSAAATSASLAKASSSYAEGGGGGEIDYRLALWKRKTEHALWVVLGKGHPVELEQTLSSYAFWAPGFVDSGVFGLGWRLWGLRGSYDEKVRVTKFSLAKPMWILPEMKRVSWGVARASWIVCLVYFVWWLWWEMAR